MVAMVLPFGAVTARLFVWSGRRMSARAIGIVMLAGPGDHQSMALDLARQHRATGAGGLASPAWVYPCPAATPA